MLKKISIICFILFLNIISIVNVNAAEYTPTSKFFVNDFANILSDETEQEIFNICLDLQNKTTAQLVVVTVPDMNGDYIESYANELFNEWGIGSSEKDNGILLIVAKDERKIRIEVGYGLEGAINDAKAGRILDEYALPSLSLDNYDEGIINTVKQLQGEIYIEYSLDISEINSEFVPTEEINDSSIIGFIIFLVIFIFLVIITKGEILRVLFYALLFSGRSGGGGFGGGFRRWRRFFWRRWFI